MVRCLAHHGQATGINPGVRKVRQRCQSSWASEECFSDVVVWVWCEQWWWYTAIRGVGYNPRRACFHSRETESWMCGRMDSGSFLNIGCWKAPPSLNVFINSNYWSHMKRKTQVARLRIYWPRIQIISPEREGRGMSGDFGSSQALIRTYK